MMEDRIGRTDVAVVIAAVLYPIVFGESEKPVGLWRWRLRRKVAKQLCAVIDSMIPVTIKDEPRIIRPGTGPREHLLSTNVIEVKVYYIRSTGQTEAITGHVDNDWCVVVPARAPLEAPGARVTNLGDEIARRRRVFLTRAVRKVPVITVGFTVSLRCNISRYSSYTMKNLKRAATVIVMIVGKAADKSTFGN